MAALSGLTIVAAIGAAAILVLFLWKKPLLDVKWRILLFVGVALLPSFAAGTSTVAGMEKTTNRKFCGSCHVMEAHYFDAIDEESSSLAARHTRNHLFGEQSCYKCHATYGMYGYPLTKLGGLGHVYYYYLGGYNKLTLEEAVEKIHISKPYPNENCLHCHQGEGEVWQSVPDHMGVGKAAREGLVSCASAGCHGSAHPFSKEAKRKAAEREGASLSHADEAEAHP